ncbi:MAG TPA: type VI secretion system protein TssA [Longimicrobium sp.]
MNATMTAGPSFPEALRRALAPLPSGHAPTPGEAYDAIREALREDDPTLPRGIWGQELKRADPGRAAELALEALETDGKDVYEAGWLVEAWTRQHGFRGMRDGLRLLVQMCGECWDHLHPVPTDDDPDARDRAFERLADKLPRHASLVPLTDGAGVPGLSWYDWQAALLRERHTRGNAADGLLPDQFREAAAGTSTAFHAATARDLADSVSALDALQALLRERAHGAPPSLSVPRHALAEIHAWAVAQLTERGVDAGEGDGSAPAPAAESGIADAIGAESAEAGDGPSFHAGAEDVDGAAPADALRIAIAPVQPAQVCSRAEAYRLLEMAADYLAKTEPHSPVPLLVRRAVAWGKLDLAGLVAELTRDGYDPQCLRTLLGLAGEERR